MLESHCSFHYPSSTVLNVVGLSFPLMLLFLSIHSYCHHLPLLGLPLQVSTFMAWGLDFLIWKQKELGIRFFTCNFGIRLVSEKTIFYLRVVWFWVENVFLSNLRVFICEVCMYTYSLIELPWALNEIHLCSVTYIMPGTKNTFGRYMSYHKVI